MNQKLKLSLSALGIVAILVVGVAIYKSSQTIPEVANKQAAPVSIEPKLATTTPVIGDKAVDASINETLNEALNETNLDAELADVGLALSDEAALDEINNLINDNEL